MSVQLNTETDAEIVLRMADLIEKGSKLVTEQVTGNYIIRNNHGTKACALGACILAAGYTYVPVGGVAQALNVLTWPKIDYIPGMNPFAVNDDDQAALPDVIIHMNDEMGWDFAHIVLWLRSTAAGMVEPETA